MPSADAPRVSILIPNFNNGRQSSIRGSDDLLGNLLASLWETLADDPTPLEIIAYDDGSTDDSIQTLRAWATRRWRSDTPFLDLIEAPHCGYLSRVANILCRRARGDILVRLDGDIACITPRWAQRLCAIFDAAPANLGVVGPKQLLPEGRIHAMGDFVLHPHGYVHVASGLDRHAVDRPIEVDHIMGCFYCCRKAMYDDVGGYDERFLRGQTEDLGLMALLRGWRALAVPDIEFVHFHTLRKHRDTQADSREGVDKTLAIFEAKWGFSRISPDIEDVQRRYQGTPLLWNRRWFGQRPRRADGPALPFEESLWTRYTKDASAQAAVNFRTGVLVGLMEQIGTPEQPVIVGAGQGLVPHMLAARGVGCRVLDDRPDHLALARLCTQKQTYPGPGANLRFEEWSDLSRLPLADGEADLIVLLDVLERHPNPARLLREAHRALMPRGVLVIFSPRGTDAEVFATSLSGQEPDAGERRYHQRHLTNQVSALRGFEFMSDPREEDPARDLMIVARRREGPAAEMPQVAEMERRIR